MAYYSTIIRGADVFDGSGQEPVKTDIGIENDKISFVGGLNGESAPREIDASGLYASPGFIDITNHSDTHWTLFSKPKQESLLYQGITTIMGGNCGVSLAPITNPSDIEGFQKWADSSDININWESFSDFFSQLKRSGLALNFASFAGHATLRRASGVSPLKPADGEDKDKMLYLLNLALKEGASGLSTSLGRGYALNADDAELEILFSALKKGSKLSVHHLEDEGSGIISAVNRLVSLARTTGVKTHFSHFKVLGRQSWPKQKTALEIVERARAEGNEITLDFFPYTSTGSSLELLLPEWAREGGKEETLRKLADPETKKKITDGLKSLTLHYERIIVASTQKNIGFAGRSLEHLAKEAGLSPEEFAADLLLSNDLQVTIFNEAILEENILELAKKDYSAVSSDGFGLDGADAKNNLSHPRSFGAFPGALKMLVKDRKILSWAEAIRKMTGLPADILGLKDRGVIGKGAFADIVLFSPEEIRDEADYKSPNRFSKGVEHLFINGEQVVSEGALLEKIPGRIL